MTHHLRSRCLLPAVLAAVLTFGLAAQGLAKTELLVFSSPNCGPCQQLKPTLDRVEQEGYAIRRIDVTQQPQLAQRFRVSRVPCLVMVADGREIDRLPHGTNAAGLRKMFAAAGVTPGQAEREVVPQWAPESPTASQPGGGSPGQVQPASLDQPATTAPAKGRSLDQRLLETSVRITVNDATGKSYGTGTIIDTREGDALLVTCGHLFRGESAKGDITIERFAVGSNGLEVLERVPGKLESYDLDRDVGLVSFRPSKPVEVAPVAADFDEQVNDRVWSVGCDRGADPTVRDSRVTAIDRYHGPPNIEASGAPVQGRSGGGLFNSDGELLGVCFAADTEGDEGLYAGLASVHAELDRLGLQDVYRPSATRLTDAEPADERPRQMVSLAATPSGQVVRGQSPESRAPAPATFPEPPSTAADPARGTASGSLGDLPAAERAALSEIADRAAETEVVVIIRPRVADGGSEVIKLDRVSPQFIDALRSMSP